MELTASSTRIDRKIESTTYVLVYSPYNDEPSAPHGGSLRHAQLMHLAAESGCNVVSTWDHWPKRVPKLRLGDLSLFQYPKLRTHPGRFANMLRLRESLRSAWKCGCRILLYEHHFQLTPQVITWAIEIGYRVIACPHNIESLIQNQSSRLTGSKSLHYLSEEMALLANAHMRFYISREDAWLAANLGAAGSYLPFRPIESSALRIKRAGTPHRGFLALGSGTNPTTQAGFEALIEMWKSVSNDHSLTIAGNGTDSLDAQSKNVTTVGTVSEDQLHALYLVTQALVVHQESGSGALTRIAEALNHGIPVIANPIAGRDYLDTPGVHIYQDLAGLKTLLNSTLNTPPAPSLPENLRNAFVASLRS